MRLRLALFAAILVALVPASAHAALTAGGPWVPNVSGLAVVNDSTWLATSGVALSRTTDAGRTWKAVVPYGTKVGKVAEVSVTSVTASGGVAFATGFWNAFTGTSGTAFGVSTDGGATWSWRRMEQRLSVGQIIADPRTPDRLVLTGYDMGSAGSPGSSQRIIFISQDRGATWQQVSSPGPAGGPLLVGQDGTIYDWMSRSTDWAASWQPMSSAQLTGVATYGPSGLVTTTTSTGATPDVRILDLKISTDRGDTWTQVPTGWAVDGSPSIVAEAPGGRVAVLVGSQVRIFDPNGTSVAEFVDRPLGAVVVQSQVTSEGSVVPTNGGVVVISTGGVENRSTGIPSYGSLEALAVSPLDRNVMLATAPSGLYRSVDGGATWAYAGNFTSVAFNPRTGVVAGVRNAWETVTLTGETQYSGFVTRLETSADGGVSWSVGKTFEMRRTTDPLGANPLGIVPGSGIVWGGDSRAYALLWRGTASSCVLGRFDNALTTLTELSVPESSGEAGCGTLVSSAENPDLVFLLTLRGATPGVGMNGLWRSTDAGATWQDISGVGQQIARFGYTSNAALTVGSGSRPAISYWIPGSVATCWSTNLGTTFACGRVPEFRIPTDVGSKQAGVVSLDYQADGALVASMGDSPQVQNPVPLTVIVRSFDNGKTWAVTSDLPEFTPTAAVDITAGKAARQGGKKKTAAGKRRFALASVGVVRQTLDFALLAKPSVRTAGIKVTRAGGGKVTVPLVCKAKHRCNGRIEGRMRIAGRFVTLAITRFSVIGSRTVSMKIAKKSQQSFKKARGSGTIRLIVNYTDPAGKSTRTSITANGPVTIR